MTGLTSNCDRDYPAGKHAASPLEFPVIPMPVALITDSSGFEWLDLVILLGLLLVIWLGGCFLFWAFPASFGKLFYWVWTHTIYRIRVVGLENLPKTGPAILVSNHVSYVDWILISAACPRVVRFIAWEGYWQNPILRFFLSLNRTIPIEGRKPTLYRLRAAFDKVKQALDQGDVVVLFPEGRLTRTGSLRPFHRGLEMLERTVKAPIVPVGLFNVWGSVFSYSRGKTLWKWPEAPPRRIGVAFGTPLPPETPVVEVRRHVQRAIAKAAKEANHWGRGPHRLFVRTAAKYPLRSCYIDPVNKRELNYGKALAGAWMLRNWLRARLGPEKIVGLWLPTSVGGALANVALTFLGKVTVNLNYTASVESIRSAIKQTGIRQVLTSKLFIRKVPLEIPYHEGAPEGDTVQIIYLEDALPQIKTWQRVLAFLQVLLLPGWFLEYVSLGLGKHKFDDLLTIIFSSGSTGEPKGIMLSHRNIASNIDSVKTAIDLNRFDRVLAVLPFFHSFGYTVLLWGPVSIGASAVYYPDPREAKIVGELCRTHRCNLMISTATFLRFYLKRCETEDFATLRLLVCGAEKLPTSLAEEFRAKFGLLPLEGYGCTELSPVASSNVPDREIKGVKQIGNKPGTVGQPLPGVAAKTVDPDTLNELPQGEEGLLMITGGNVMVGYLNRPDLTEKAIRDGWYNTGDMARIDEDGFITITGRLSRFAKIAGEMVPLEMVEEEMHAALETSDRILAVTSVPDPAKGERLIVLYVALPVPVRQLIQRTGDRNLPNLWIPKERDFFQVTELPLLGTGKLNLKLVKEMAIEVTQRSTDG